MSFLWGQRLGGPAGLHSHADVLGVPGVRPREVGRMSTLTVAGDVCPSCKGGLKRLKCKTCDGAGFLREVRA